MADRGLFCGFCKNPLSDPYGASRYCYHDYKTIVKRAKVPAPSKDEKTPKTQTPLRYLVIVEDDNGARKAPVIIDDWNNLPDDLNGGNTASQNKFKPDSIFILKYKDDPTEVIGPQPSGYQSDSYGNPNQKGGNWCMPLDNGRDFTIYKYRKHSRAKVTNKPQGGYNPEMKINEKRTAKLLRKACAKLGFSYLNSVKLIRFSRKIDTACWFFNHQTMEEGILVNPAMAQRSIMDLIFCLQHEVMHRALYRNMRGLKDPETAQIALDCCINRVIVQNASGTRNKRAMEFFGWIYPQKTRKNLLALCNPTIKPSELAALGVPLAKLWVEIWGGFKNAQGKFASEQLPPLSNLNPRSIYYRLRALIQSGAGGQKIKNANGKGKDGWGSPFGKGNNDDEEGTSTESYGRHKDNQHVSTKASEKMEDAVKKFSSKRARRKGKRGGFSSFYSKNSIEEWWEENVLSLDEIEQRALADFAQRMRTLNLLESAKAKLMQSLTDDSLEKPYPEVLTPFGMEMISLGMHEPYFPIYYNCNHSGHKKKVAVYLDLSPSMGGILGYIPDVLDVLESQADVEYHTGVDGKRGGFVFSGSVTQITAEQIEAMRKGKVTIAGYSTCFNAVCNHAVEQVEKHDVDIILIVTDGESVVTPDVIQRFNKSGKHCYSVVMQEDGSYAGEHIKQIIDNSCLRELNGEVLPLVLPRIDYDHDDAGQNF